jgi:hypothetical protein
MTARAPSNFRQKDVTKAINAVRRAGCGVARVIIDKTGAIIISTVEDPSSIETLAPNEWDQAV